MLKKMMRDDFGVFILSHGRSDNLKTVRMLKKFGYTGKLYIVIDNEDDTAADYYDKFGDKVIMFDKLAVSKTFDTADNFDDRRAVVYARNACFDMAEKRGLRYFLELDDDYHGLYFRVVKGGQLASVKVEDADALFEKMIACLDAIGGLTLAFTQAGDFIGGKDSRRYRQGIVRKAMNAFFCDVEKRFQFVGRINEDVNTYVTLGMRGERIFSTCRASIVQGQTQQNKGGMTELYLDTGTYLKSFYTVMMAPSCVCVRMMGTSSRRLHHNINWNLCVPKILDERHKKSA